MDVRVATIRRESDTLTTGLKALMRAMWVWEAAIWLVRGLAVGLSMAVLALVLARVLTVPSWTPALLVAVGVLAALIVASTRPRSVSAAALRADARLQLRERLTTAWELRQRGASTPLASAQIADATSRLARIDPWRTFRPPAPRLEIAIAVGLLVTVLALIVLPNPHKLAVQQQAAQQRVIAEQAQAVAKLAQQIESASGPRPTAEQAADVQALKQLQQQLDQKPRSAQDALANLTAAEDRLRSQDTSAAAAEKNALDKAAAALTAAQGDQSLTRSLAQSIAQGQFQQAAQQLQQLGQQSQQLSQSQRDQLQSTLRAAGAAAAKTDPNLGNALQQAANSMGSANQPADPAAQQQAFNAASSALQQAGQQVTSGAQTQQALAQIQDSESAISAAQQSQESGQSGQVSGAPNAPGAAQAGQGQTQQPAQVGAAGQPGDQTGQATQGQTDSTPSAAQGQGDQSGQAQGSGAAQGGQSGTQGDGQNGPGQAGGHGPGGGPNNQVYAPTTPPGHTEQLPTQQGSGASQQTTGDQLGNPNNNQSLVPYNQVIGSYQQEAAQQMDRAYVPLDKKDLVKNYFSSLATGK